MKILLVRLREIGDVVFTTPAISALRARFPDAHLTYLVEPLAAPVVRQNPALNDVLVVERSRGVRGLLADLALGRRLRSERFDVAIDFHGGPRASLLTWLSRAPTRIGYNVVGRGWMYTNQIERSRTLQPRHSVVNQWDLLAPLGVAPPDRARFPVTMTLADDVDASVQARLLAHGIGTDDRVIVMHVSAGNPFRRWPIASFAEVAATLAESMPSARIVVTSGPSDAAAAAQVIAEARARLPGVHQDRVARCGEFSLTELRALVERAALFIGGDSGPMHIAATSRVPMVSLYGPTLPARSAPWRPLAVVSVAVEVDGLPCRPCDQRVCAPGDFRCLTGISAQRVIETAARVLEETR